ncbi:MAG: hypothetical protein V3R98_12080 [Alphaproteobacteria bacterium]
MADPTAHFDGIIAGDRRSLRHHLALLAGLVAAGVIVLAVGVVLPLDDSSAVVELGGLLIGALGTIPLKQWMERRDRLVHVEFLRDRWRQLAGRQRPPETQLTRIENIVWTLYEQRAAG